MSRIESLRSLENLLESFLGKAAALREDKLTTLGGSNRLDIIAPQSKNTAYATIEVGEWLAKHADLMKEKVIPAADAERIKSVLAKISDDMESAGLETKETQKIRTEIEKWQTKLVTEPEEPVLPAGQKLVLKRASETTEQVDKGSVEAFTKQLQSMLELWEGISDRRPHILSALDDLLKKAYLQHNQECLLLSGFIIYYMRQNGYLVEPYVKRLKAAESLIKQSDKSA